MVMPISAFAGETQPTHVVELFTSQGCSSCPPANAFVGDVSHMPDTLVLSYGVTYWDYLGWKDTFADPAFTKRQRAYGKAFESANVYTPQIVLNGAAHGSRYSKWDVSSMALPDTQPRLTPRMEDGVLYVNIQDAHETTYDTILVEYVKGPQSVPVGAGENQGRVLTLTNVVTDLHTLGEWDAKSRSELKTSVKPKPGKTYAMLLTEPGTMRIKAAATFHP